jgi:hypothetical protein
MALTNQPRVGKTLDEKRRQFRQDGANLFRPFGGLPGKLPRKSPRRSPRKSQDYFSGVAPFDRMGGLGKMFQLFGNQMEPLLTELNEALAA